MATFKPLGYSWWNCSTHTERYRRRLAPTLRRYSAAYPTNRTRGQRGRRHNNHHAHPRSARHRLGWYEFDLNWYEIRLLGSADAPVEPFSIVRRYPHWVRDRTRRILGWLCSQGSRIGSR